MCISRGLHPLEPPLLFFGGGSRGRQPLYFTLVCSNWVIFLLTPPIQLLLTKEKIQPNKKVKSGAVTEWLRWWT